MCACVLEPRMWLRSESHAVFIFPEDVLEPVFSSLPNFHSAVPLAALRLATVRVFIPGKAACYTARLLTLRTLSNIPARHWGGGSGFQ